MLWLFSGSSQSKTAYIDPPLLKMELSWRERSLLFHQESVKLAFKKTVSRPVFFLTSEELPVEMEPPPEVRCLTVSAIFEGDTNNTAKIVLVRIDMCTQHGHRV